jgi:drug/metabolite transporter (DMT)-like permease
VTVHVNATPRRSATTALIAASALFGVDTTISAFVLRQVGAADLFLAETSVGALCLWAFVWVTGRYRRPANLGPHILLGLIEPGFAYLLFDVGLPRTTAVAGGLLISTETIIGVGLAVVILRERLRAPAVLALVTGVIGTALVSIGGAGQGHGQVLGDLIVLLAALTGGTYLVLARRIPCTDDALTGTAYQLAAAWAVAAVYAAVTWSTGGSKFGSAGGLTIGLTLATGVVGIAIPFVLLNRSLEVLQASTAGLLLNLIPVFAVVSAVALLGEPLMVATVAGGAAILFGLTLLARSEDTGTLNSVDNTGPCLGPPTTDSRRSNLV